VNKNKKYKILEYNNVRIQNDNINCGILVIDFIVSMINGVSYKKWIENMLSRKKKYDIKTYTKFITSLRCKYFR